MNNTFGVTMTCEYDGEGLEQDAHLEWPHRRWQCILSSARDGWGERILIKRGIALDGEPTLIEVLECVQTDCRIHENDDYDEFLEYLPYSKARKMADAIKDQVKKAHAVFDDRYDDFLAEEYEV